MKHILQYNYLKPKHLEGFTKYKYVSVDSSPLSVYLTNPIWDRVVQFLPSWLAPNLMTFIGFLLTVINIGVLSYYDYHFYASTKIYPDIYPPIPRWVWLMCSINQFLSYALDSCDGKQARRTGTSSPLGELFDHGLDSWASIFVPMSFYSLYGRALSGLPPLHVFFVLWGVLIVFLIAHWEKYITGVFYLPWAYDASQLALSLVFLISFFCGHEFWHFKLPITRTFSLNPGNLVEYAVFFSAFGVGLPTALYHIYRHYQTLHPTKKEGENGGNSVRRITLSQALKPLIPVALLFVSSVAWAIDSPTDIVNREPRAFYLLLGTVYSNIVSKIVIAQMSGTTAKAFNFLLVPYLTVVFGLINVLPSIQNGRFHKISRNSQSYEMLQNIETYSLYILLTFSIATHIHFGIRIVKQLSTFLGVYVFDITRKRTGSNINSKNIEVTQNGEIFKKTN